MQIISISRGTQSLGVEFAQALASRLGYECVSREDLLEEATRQHIPIGKLETAIVKPHIHSERLIAELGHYKALATSILCQKALDHSVVYHGRTGHLLLPGIDHILRIRVETDMEQRIANVMTRLRLPRKKASQYIKAVEEDRRRWVKNFYNVDWEVFTLYDLVLNLSKISVTNAASAICSLAQLPDFQPTPASTAALKDLELASRARLALARDQETGALNINVTARHGIIHVTYSFLQSRYVDSICRVLREIHDAVDVVCTQAQTSILWLQEQFEPDDKSIGHMVSLAGQWDAAVEVIKFTPGQDMVRMPVAEDIARRGLESWRQAGIIDEYEETVAQEPDDVAKTYERLVNSGRAGGKRVLQGSLKSLISTIDRSVSYRLIVLDNIFLNKSPEARKRMIQDWSNSLSDALKVPVVTMKELEMRYRFGWRQAVRMAIAAVLTALMVYGILYYENDIISVVSNDDTATRIMTAAGIVLFVPIYAFIYSSFTGRFLRMLGLD